MKALTQRQSIIIMLLSIIATKFFVLPIFLAEGMKQNIIFIMPIFLIIELLLVLIVVKSATTYKDYTFYDILQYSFGKIYAKIIFIMLFILFLGKNILNINETYSFFLNTLYDSINPYLYIIPFAILFFYSYLKGLNAIGRTTELTFKIILIGIVLAIIIGISKVDFTNLLPFFQYPIDQSINTLQENIFWFGDFFVFLMFFGDIKFEKKYIRNISIVVVLGILLLILFYTLYFCLFPYNSGLQHFAVSDITQFASSLSNFGRIDWITSFIWTMASILQSIIYYFCATKCLQYIFGENKKILVNCISIAILLIALFILQFNLTATIYIAHSPLRFIVFFLMIAGYLLLPIHNHILKQRNFYAKQTNYTNN